MGTVSRGEEEEQREREGTAMWGRLDKMRRGKIVDGLGSVEEDFEMDSVFDGQPVELLLYRGNMVK